MCNVMRDENIKKQQKKEKDISYLQGLTDNDTFLHYRVVTKQVSQTKQNRVFVF